MEMKKFLPREDITEKNPPPKGKQERENISHLRFPRGPVKLARDDVFVL
jgi:hypothetical protein